MSDKCNCRQCVHERETINDLINPKETQNNIIKCAHLPDDRNTDPKGMIIRLGDNRMVSLCSLCTSDIELSILKYFLREIVGNTLPKAFITRSQIEKADEAQDMA